MLVADQVTKALVLQHLGPGGARSVVDVIPGVLRLLYVENTGAAFGVFQGRSPVLTLLAIGVVVFLGIYFRRAIAESRALALALGLEFGGAVGNILDRLRHGFVVDFIDVPHWPTFNVADSAITVGVLLLALVVLRHDSRPRDAADRGDVEAADRPTRPTVP
ncbi:MAG: signal peptidase II [Thermomicrobiaceae bacterium]|nr:signal peptidase II [Thermomicrobiaceae bacterium]